MKVKNLRKRKKCANKSLESITKRLATQSQYRRPKVANELAECREDRLFNLGQHQKEKIKNESTGRPYQTRETGKPALV